MNQNETIFIAGHKGMVGSAIVRHLQAEGFSKLICCSRAELDLTDQSQVGAFFEAQRPDYVFVAAAKVGGILANNTYPADFIYQNLQIECNLIHHAHRLGVRKLLFLGSSCIYPRMCPQPMQERHLLTGPLEPTNEAYAIAKIAGIKLCEYYHRQYQDDFISVMPTNLYGPGDNFNLQNSHVIPALMRKFHEAKVARQATVEVWGTGQARREFMHVDDLAAACLHVMQRVKAKDLYGQGISHLNVGTGQEVTIAELCEVLRGITGFEGRIAYDTDKPDGTPRKLLDVSRLAQLGWRARIELNTGLADAYGWYLKHVA